MTSLRIAVADDEPDIREYFGKILPRLGHTVVVSATSGEELVEGCRRTRPDLVITDIKMPGMSGLDAAVQLRAELDLAIIVVSGYADRVKRAGRAPVHVDAYLLKPIKRTDLETAILAATQPR